MFLQLKKENKDWLQVRPLPSWMLSRSDNQNYFCFYVWSKVSILEVESLPSEATPRLQTLVWILFFIISIIMHINQKAYTQQQNMITITQHKKYSNKVRFHWFAKGTIKKPVLLLTFKFSLFWGRYVFNALSFYRSKMI